jgi:pimeloyl-ACP methyl ester carboxylesterase
MDTVTIDPGEVELSEYGAPGRPAWADVDWTLYRRSAIVDGRKVNYVDIGDPAGVPVVMIHGLAGCWQNWLENILPFANRYRVIVPDLPGFGQSDMPRDPISIPGYASIVHTLLGQLGVGRAALVGNSMGGMISLQMAIEYPDAVACAIAVSPAGLATRLANPERVQPAVRGVDAIMRNSIAMREKLVRRPGLRRVALWGVITHPELIRAELAWELMGGAGKAAFMPALEAIMRHDFSEQLGEITAPTLFVWGREDRLITYRDCDRYVKRIPGARKLVVRDTGHMTMLERPAWFNAVAADFIDGSA